MIQFNYETDFKLNNELKLASWISAIISSEGCIEGNLNYIFCDDDYLHKINVEFLEHDTLTDIISFDYSIHKELHGDIFISVDRVKENAKIFNTIFRNELHRVMIHGVLHLIGYKDKTIAQKNTMRNKENSALKGLKP